jgi:putative peptidoglycan binding protein
MASDYTIKQGDYLAKVAKEHGFADWKPIWDHASNKALRDKRKDPNILLPGDQLHIPDREIKEHAASTEAKHRYVVKRPRLQLVLRLDEMFKSPMAGASYQLLLGDEIQAKTTDGGGKLAHDLTPGISEARLIVKDVPAPGQDIAIPIKIGHLDPVEERSGQAQRLNNLAYFAGPYPDNDEKENERIYVSAVQEFQCDQQLKVDGVCGPQTQAKLVDAHGS